MQGCAERKTGDCARTTSCLCHGVSQQGQLGESLGQTAPLHDDLAYSATIDPKKEVYARNRWTCGYAQVFVSTVCLWYAWIEVCIAVAANVLTGGLLVCARV